MKTNDGWEYKFYEDEGKIKACVIPPEALKLVIPKTLFKYYELNCNNVDALKNSYLYASEPSQLNDPFDCHPNLIEYEKNEKENITKYFKISSMFLKKKRKKKKDEKEEKRPNLIDSWKGDEGKRKRKDFFRKKIQKKNSRKFAK